MQMQEDKNFDWSLYEDTSKYNTRIKISAEDRKNKFRVLCKESYAQELYTLYSNYEKGVSKASIFRKDLEVGDVCMVRATSVSFDDRKIYAEDLTSKVSVSIPFREYSNEIKSLIDNEASLEFYVEIYRITNRGEYLASERKAASISHKQELFDYLNRDKWFEVKLTKLIKGGYLAMYRDVECFVPGSHAAANIVHDFNALLGKTIPVMVDNYDPTNDLFILSYKKYISHSMPEKITDLRFDREYTGVLTNSPYDFGVFVEFEGYYTGLVHKSEFENYEEVRRRLRTGDQLSVYVKDVTQKNGQYRIVLTLTKDQVSDQKMHWQQIRNSTENQKFSYQVMNNGRISINVNGEELEVSVRKKDLEKNLSNFPFVRVFKVDPINQSIKLEFVGENA